MKRTGVIQDRMFNPDTMLEPLYLVVYDDDALPVSEWVTESDLRKDVQTYA